MEISKRWRIVPQLCLAFLSGAGPAFAGPTDLPSAPDTTQQARELLQQMEGLNLSAMQEFDRQKAACQEKVLISNCLREVESRVSRYRRDSKTLEINAREMVRLEEQKGKTLAKQQKPAAKPLGDEPPLKADDPAIPSRREPKPAAGGDAAATSVQPAQPAMPRPDKPALTEQEQAQNRSDYERKSEQARQRQQENLQRQQELDARRERYKQAQEEKARKAEKQAADRAARAAGGL